MAATFLGTTDLEGLEIDPIYQTYSTYGQNYNFGFVTTIGDLKADENREQKDLKLRDLMDTNSTRGNNERGLEQTRQRGSRITNEFAYPRVLGSGGKRSATLTLRGPAKKKLRFSVTPLITN